MSHPINFDYEIEQHEKKIKELKRQKAVYLNFPTWYVIGGEYTDTTFSSFKDKEERYGPFVEYQEAIEQWRSKSWSNVDSCHTRYHITSSDDL